MATATYELIESNTLSSTASSVTFTSIDQSFRDLVLVIRTLQTNVSARAFVQFNNDTGTNYIFQGSSANGSSFSAYRSTGGTRILGAYPNGVNISQIMDYSKTDRHKIVLARTQGDFSSGVEGTEMRSSRWANNSAITEIDINADTQDFPSGSTFALYGIAG